MDNFTIKAVITNVYCKEPIWINKKLCSRESIILDKDSNEDEISLFFALLFDYNDVEYGKNISDSLNNLLKEKELILSGGPCFNDGKITILPSCCCGLEQLKSVFLEISHGTSPWLGHDPYPTITYSKNGNIKIWADDPKKNSDVDYIICSHTKLISEWIKMNDKLIEFFDKSCLKYLEKYSVENRIQIIKHIKENILE